MKKMKHNNLKAPALTFLFMAITAASWACPVCEKQQPKLLRGVAHGAGPDTNWDYFIVGGIAAIVVITLYFSMKLLVRPGEKTPDHIKRHILDLD